MKAELPAPGAVRWIARTLEEAGFETWTVGGAVRDALRGAPSEDWDLATRATPAEVQALFRRTVPVGVAHGTVGVLAGSGVLYEVTTFRRDVETTGRHAVVAFSDSLDEDLARRDFTINAVAWHPLRRSLRDPHDGRADLRRGLLRTVGDPGARFREDYLRILRALRFAGRFGLRIEAETWRSLTRAVERTRDLSPERVRDEMERILGGEGPPSGALGLYAAAGVLRVLYPELASLVGLPRGATGDWFSHSLRTVDLLPLPRTGHTGRRWAALLQAVGEAEKLRGQDGEERDPGERTRRRCTALLERLRASNAMTRDTAHRSAWILRPPAGGAAGEELRRWLAAAGREVLPDLLRLWIASARADEARGGAPGEAGGRWPARGELAMLIPRLRSTARSGVPLTVRELALSGRDLIRMGLTPGPRFGELLECLLERTLGDPSLNEPGALAREARLWLAGHGLDAPGGGPAGGRAASRRRSGADA